MKMAAVRAGAILVFLSVFPGSERVSGQRAPCYECEDYKENHPRTSPYQQIRSHCSYPCKCDDVEPTCPPDVSVIRDGCGCCPICAGQPGQPCDGTSVCDDHKGLICRYPYSGATVGICQAATGLPCMVFNKTYNHGETFQTDCRTQCSCQNGTYACSSLCPNENISPRGACTHPRLVEVPDQCCREWMCDSTEAEHPPVCKQQFTSWSRCSAECGLGISRRVSNLNQNCILQNETRICQLRPCEAGMLSLEQRARHRHIRKGHECKATQRVRGPVRLRFGPCRSKKRYRPKFCGSCDDKLGDGCCTPQLSTTIKVEFVCSSIRSAAEDPEDVLIDLIEPGRDLWWPDDLLAIGKQPGTTPPVEPASEPATRDGYASRVAPIVPKEDMHLLGKDKQNESPLGGDVLIYDPELSENVIGLVTPNMLKERLETKLSTLSLSTERSTTTATTINPTTPKPKKKKKKKPRKAFTSWLEFRDEEYQMDEYEDEAEENEHSRRKREAVGKKYSGSFREGYLEEVQAKEDDYDDEDDEDDEDEDEDDDDDEEEEEEEEEEDEDSGEEEDEDEETTKRNRSARKPVFYAFYRRKREAAFSGKSAYPNKHFSKKEPEAPKVDRLARISLGREKPDVRKRRGKKAKIQAKERRTQAEKGRGNGIPERKAKPDDGDLFRLGKILTGKDATREEPKRQRGKKPLYHTAGKVHKSRTRRHAPRPPWPKEEEDLSWGDHTVSFSVQWIAKCHCGRDCGADGTASPAGPGAVVLRRVHRTAPP